MSDLAAKGQTTGRRRGFRFLSLVWLVCGLAFSLAASGFAAFASLLPLFQDGYRPMLAVSALSFLVAAAIVRYIRRFALVNLWSIVIWCGIGFAVFGLFVLALSDQEYSLVFLALFAVTTITVLSVWVLIIRKVQSLRLAVIPEGLTDEVLRASHPQLTLQVLRHSGELRNLTGVDGIVLDVEAPLDDPWVRAVGQWSAARKRIYAASDLFEAITGRVSLVRISSGIVAGFTTHPGYQLIKRSFDVIGVIVTAPLTLLLMAITALAVKLESPGPAIFSQLRVGLGGKRFTIYKFRSMCIDSEQSGPRFAEHRDSRVTRVGAFIRRFRIDEIPQMWNIFRGDMSLIGPRPEQPGFVEEFNEQIPYYAYRHQVRPGITGWAQVHQGYAADVEATRDKLEYDLYYIKHLSFWLDILIGFKTLRTIVTGFGAR